MNNTTTISTVDPVDGFDLGEYRYAAAAFLRTMILARAKDDGRFLTDEEFSAWDLDKIEQATGSQLLLLRQADIAHEKLWQEFIGPNGSGGDRLHDPHGGLKNAVVHFMFETTPSDLIEQLRPKKKKIPWRRVAKWDNLSQIRKWLDRLPHPHTGCPIIIVGAKNKEVRVLGQQRFLKSVPQVEVLSTVVEVYPNRLSMSQLIERSGYSSAHQILKAIKELDDLFDSVISMAETRGKGYGIVWPDGSCADDS